MTKYLLLICSLLFTPLMCNGEIIIGDLKIDATTRNNEIRITNISKKTIENIQTDGRPTDFTSLKPNEEILMTFTPYDEEAMESELKEIEKE